MNMRDLTDAELLRVVDRSNPEVKELAERLCRELNTRAETRSALRDICELVAIARVQPACFELEKLIEDLADENSKRTIETEGNHY